MARLAPNRATNLAEAFRICSLAPLEGEDIERYYVPLDNLRKSKAVEGVSTLLEFQEPGQSRTILFTGHRGSGKSTELKRIQSRWAQDYEVIYLEANEETDINDVRYTEIYLIVIKQIEFAMRELKLKFDRQLLENVENWFKEVTQENETTVEKSVSATGEASLGAEAPFLAKLLVKLLAQIKGSEKQKKTIRQTLQNDISRLKADTNLLLNDATRKLRNKKPECRGFLIIFDNLDRIPLEVSQHLFFDYAAQLKDLHCNLIYTAPISVLCSPQGVVNTFGQPNLMSMPNIYEFDRHNPRLSLDQSAVAYLATLIEKRVEIEKVFDSPERILELARHSGGHVRQLMQMTQTSCRVAKTRGHSHVTAEDVIYAFKQEQFGFERFMPDDHYPRLATVCLTKDVTKDEVGQLMLYNTSVMEYNGNQRWNYVNPAVRASNLFQEALERAIRSSLET